jgi:hypothetical protein
MSLDARRLEISEELSESLANDLLELSVVTKNRDLEKTAQFFPEELAADTFPSEPSDTKSEVKWIMSNSWTAKPASASSSSGKTGRIKATDFLVGWSAFLDHFRKVEDARFKVKVANFDDSAQAIIGAEVPTAVLGASGHARAAFFVIGRDHENRREWARGVVEADLLYGSNKHWQFHPSLFRSVFNFGFCAWRHPGAGRNQNSPCHRTSRTLKNFSGRLVLRARARA